MFRRPKVPQLWTLFLPLFLSSGIPTCSPLLRKSLGASRIFGALRGEILSVSVHCLRGWEMNCPKLAVDILKLIFAFYLGSFLLLGRKYFSVFVFLSDKPSGM